MWLFSLFELIVTLFDKGHNQQNLFDFRRGMEQEGEDGVQM